MWDRLSSLADWSATNVKVIGMREEGRREVGRGYIGR
jgi:hypothetical protein